MIYPTYTLQCDGCGQLLIGCESEKVAQESADEDKWLTRGGKHYCMYCRAVLEVNAVLLTNSHATSGYTMSDGSEVTTRVSSEPVLFVPIDGHSIGEIRKAYRQKYSDSHREAKAWPVDFFARPSTPEEIAEYKEV